MKQSFRSSQWLGTIALIGMACAWWPRVAAQPPGVAPAPRKQASIALVVGNTAYERQPLPNAVNDSRSVAEKLRALGFSVLEQSNATRKGLESMVTAFADQLDDYDVAVFYYAGHGLQMDGNNYLVPIDAVTGQAIQEPSALFAVSTLISRMRGSKSQSARVNVIILDACRDLRGARLVANSQIGFARFQDTRGVFIAFSASYGQTAQDGADGNSPYTKALLQHLVTPGLSLPELFQRVRTDVERSTGQKQSPREENGLTGYASVSLVPSTGVSSASTRSVATPPRAPLPSATPTHGPNAALLSDVNDVAADQRLAWLRERLATTAISLTPTNVRDLLKDFPIGTHRAAMSLLVPSLADALPPSDVKMILEAVSDPPTRMNALATLASEGKVANRLTTDEYVTIMSALSGVTRIVSVPTLASRIAAAPAKDGTVGSGNFTAVNVRDLLADVPVEYRFGLINALRQTGRFPAKFSPQDREMLLAGTVSPYRELLSNEFAGMGTTSMPAASMPAAAAAPARSVALPGLDYKQLAMTQDHWLSCHDAFCSTLELRLFYPAIKRIEFGESADHLDRIIEVPRSSEGVTTPPPRALQFIPIRHGVSNEFVRLEFIDGSKSDVRTAANDRDKTMADGAIVLAGERDAPRLFIGYTLGKRIVELTPETPIGVTAVQYAINERGFLPAKRLESQFASDYGFRISLSDTKHQAVQIKLQLSDGTERGPFTYRLDPAAPLVGRVLKASFAQQFRNAIECVEVDELSPMTRPRLAARGLEFVVSTPVIACVPSDNPGLRDSLIPTLYAVNWAAVREIRVGTRPAMLDRSSKVSMTIDDVLGTPSWSFTTRSAIWHTTVAAGGHSVYAQAVYVDGSSTPEFQIPVEPFERRR